MGHVRVKLVAYIFRHVPYKIVNIQQDALIAVYKAMNVMKSAYCIRMQLAV